MGEALITRRGGGGSVELELFTETSVYDNPDYNNYDYLIVGYASYASLWGMRLCALVTGPGQVSGLYEYDGSGVHKVFVRAEDRSICVDYDGDDDVDDNAYFLRVYPKGSLEIKTE